MGSVITMEDCPNCNSQACVDFYYKTGEEYTFCHHCGYSKEVTFEKQKAKVIEIKSPYGAFKVRYRGQKGSMSNVLTSEDDLFKLKLDLEADRENIETALLSRYVDDKIVITNLLTH